mmetsp:Transcript_12526/g.35707  ORF Transcript_12526/g.35707 Transcript_12526/m.35707 type:complete len:228 (+) Transcript_12526:30-713(+)
MDPAKPDCPMLLALYSRASHSAGWVLYSPTCPPCSVVLEISSASGMQLDPEALESGCRVFKILILDLHPWRLVQQVPREHRGHGPGLGVLGVPDEAADKLHRELKVIVGPGQGHLVCAVRIEPITLDLEAPRTSVPHPGPGLLQACERVVRRLAVRHAERVGPFRDQREEYVEPPRVPCEAAGAAPTPAFHHAVPKDGVHATLVGLQEPVQGGQKSLQPGFSKSRLA